MASIFTFNRGVNCFYCKLFGSTSSSRISFVKRDEFSDWKNVIVIDHHEKCSSHKEAMVAYLTRRLGTGIQTDLDKQMREECKYWEHVLERVIAVISTKFGSMNNGNFIGLLELIAKIWKFWLRNHIVLV